MQFFFALSLLAFLGVTNAALSILYPNSETTWYKNNTVSVNWTSSDPTDDTYLVRVLLSNSDQSLLSGNHSLADSINATSDFVAFLLPSLNDGSGFIVTLVNTSNQEQIFATSDPFAIQDGTTPNTTTSASMSSTSAAAATNIPNAVSTSSITFPSASPSTSASASSKSSAGMTQYHSAAGLVVLAVAFVLGLAVVV